MISKVNLVFVLFCIIFGTNFVFSQEVEKVGLDYLYFFDDESSTYKVSYEVMYDNLDERNFEMRYYFEDEIVDDVCLRDLVSQSDFDRAKITCDIDKLGEGRYVFVAIMLDSQDNLIEKEVNVLNFQKNIYSEIEFLDFEDKTTIIINVEGFEDNLLIKNRIPKEVIEILNDENKDSLINSYYEYEILEEDPLIAWSVESTPTKINYTINKKVSISDREKFDVEITKSSNFKIVKYLVIFLLFLIIVFIFKPMFKK